MITFNNENVKMPPIERKLVRTWLKQVADGYGREVGNLNYIFCDDERILEINKEFIGHDYYTDIITFDYSDPKVVHGDMYISLDTVFTNSKKFNTSYKDELMRVTVHGLLHLCGIDDKGPGERAIMESAENDALFKLKNMIKE
jgi:probable rRNA maturation factor